LGDEGTDDLENDISVASRAMKKDHRFHHFFELEPVF
jgi:hypothetical protein